MAGSTKTVHAHGCTQCHGRYEDNCTDKIDRICTNCRSGRTAESGLYVGRLPQDCCFTYSRLSTKDDLKTYTLAGQHVWWTCPVCFRTHPCKPER